MPINLTIFFVMKNIKNTKFKGQKQFSKNTQIKFSVFSKIVLNNDQQF